MRVAVMHAAAVLGPAFPLLLHALVALQPDASSQGREEARYLVLLHHAAGMLRVVSAHLRKADRRGVEHQRGMMGYRQRYQRVAKPTVEEPDRQDPLALRAAPLLARYLGPQEPDRLRCRRQHDGA
eukprot:757619-Hanusia_phi.AAC.1